MALKDLIVCRVYRCSACEGEVAVKQAAGEPWLKTCPFCDRDELLIKSGSLEVSTFVDMEVPKTLGVLAEKNTLRKEKEGTLPPPKFKPWWRKHKKSIDYRVLKNPSKYVETGEL